MSCTSIPPIAFIDGSISFLHDDIFTGYDIGCAILVIGIVDVVATSIVAVVLAFIV